MKFTLLLPLLTGVLFSGLTAQAADHARAAYQDSSKINKYSRRAMLARAPNLTPVRWNYPVPYVAPSVTMPEHAYSTVSVYDQPGYRPASTSSSYVALNSGGFGGRAYRYQTGYAPYYYGSYADPYLYGGYYGGSTVIVNRGNFHRGFGGGGVRFVGGRMGGRFR